MGYNRPPIRLTLAEAEERLFLEANHHGRHRIQDMTLRKPFQVPDGIYAEDVHIKMLCMRTLDETTKSVTAILYERLKYYFPASREDAKLILRIYVCEATEGDTFGRICSSETGFGVVRLCLGWTLAFPDGSVVLDGGRMEYKDDHFYGLGDIFLMRSGYRTLMNDMVPRLSDKIYYRLDLPSKRPWYDKLRCM